MLSCFSLTAFDSHGILHLAFSLVSMHSTSVSKWAVTKFSYLLFEVCLSDVSPKVSILFLIVIYIDCIYHYW